MLTIRQQQLDTFSQVAQRAFETEMASHCNDFSPQFCKVIGEEQLRVVIRRAIERAAIYGITNRGPVRSYIEMVLLFGSDFDTDPQYPWVKEILTSNKYAFQMERSELLYQKTLDYLDKVVGPEDSFTLGAYHCISQMAKKGRHFSQQNLLADLLQKSADIYPEKHAYVGDAAMTLLIKEAIHTANTYEMTDDNDIAIISLLMVAFGHGCTNDPLYPWIARTLTNAKTTGASARARRLEKKALTWLDHVITWHKEGEQA